MDEASIFLEALNQPSPEERAAFLAEACGGDDELRRGVELLLKAHDKAGDFLAPAPVVATVDQPITESTGTVIGAYKLGNFNQAHPGKLVENARAMWKWMNS